MPGHLGVIYSNDAMWQRVKVLDMKAGNRNNIEVSNIWNLGVYYWYEMRISASGGTYRHGRADLDLP